MFTIDSKANSRITDDSNIQPQRFVFPSEINPNLRFGSIEEIRDYLRRE